MTITFGAPAPPTITVIGSLNVDLTAYTSRIPTGGETLYANSFKIGSGGKGGNQASACARLSRSSNLQNSSATIKMVGAIGDDTHGATILNDLQKNGVDISRVVVRPDVETGVAIVLVEEKSGQNRILINPGANHGLRPHDFRNPSDLKASLIILQLEIPVDTILQILRTARESNIDVLLNPAPAVALPDEAYVDLEHLIMNETEAAILSGSSVSDIDDIEKFPEVTQVFHDKGVKNVIITLGGRGVFYSAIAGTSGLINANNVKVVDTTAAGDTFVGAYALETIKASFDIGAAVQKANNVAARAVQKKGAQNSIPWLDEIS